MILYLDYMMFYVYILYSATLDIYYKGQTSDLEERLKRLNLGREKATMSGVPWKLVYSATKPNRSEALVLERKLKNLSRERIFRFIEKYSV